MTELRESLQASLGTAFTLERELGGGGMSRVFIARDEALNREIVVKILAPELAQALSAERFTREIRLAAGLQHSHIVPVLTAGQTTDGLPWYTMPFVAGESLRARLMRGPIPFAEAVSVLRNVAQALAHAHERGIVHRDIKPENVLLSSGTAVVADFGIAKALSASKTSAPDGTLTSVGSSIGTPAYMAPEQAVGDVATDHRADIYSWGVIAYELLSGAHPSADRKTPQALIAAHIAEIPEPLGKRSPQIPAPIVDLVTGCLEKSPSARPQDMNGILALLAGAGVATTPADGLATGSITAASRRRRSVMSAGIAILVIVAVLAVVWRGRSGGGSSGAGGRTIETLAVLPFVNVGGDAKDEYFSDGVTDELTHALSRLPGLRLVGRSSAFAFKGKNVSAREIGRQLDVAGLIEGTVRRSGGRLRITVQLTSSADGKALWQDSYENDKDDVFQVQDDVTKAIVAAVSPTLRGTVATTNAVASRGTTDTASYTLYLQGRYFWARRGEASLLRAAQVFKDAIAKDPTFARAHAGLGLVYTVLPSWSERMPVDSANVLAEAAARRALGLDSTLSDGYMILGSVRRQQARLSESVDYNLTAMRLDPDNATAHQWQAITFAGQGEIAKALGEIRQAKALDPLSNTIANNEVTLLMAAGDFATARQAAWRILDRDSLHYNARFNLALAQTFGGFADSAIATLQTASRMPHNTSGGLGREVFANAALGRWSEADRLRARIAERRDSLVSDFDAMLAAMAYGDHATAIDLLTRNLRTSGLNSGWYLSVSCEPVFVPLRNDQRFIALMKRFGMKICSSKTTWPIGARPR